MFLYRKKSETVDKSTEIMGKSRISSRHTRSPAWTSVHGNQPRLKLQRKLTINQSGDTYEQEADHLADTVMRMPVSDLQRQSIKEEDEDVIQTKRASGKALSDVAPTSVHETLRSPGQPLDTRTRAFMEPRFGHDFGDARVHTDGQAARSAADINARAYTVGNNIVFSAGQFQPGSSAGDHLIAHELAHTVQQRSSVQGLQRASENVKPYPAVILSTEDMNVQQAQKYVTSKSPRIGTGKKIEKFGIAYKEEGVNLRDVPHSHPDSKVLELLPFNTRMYVDSVVDNYYFASTDDGKFGYVAVSHVKTNLPEPDSKIYHIKSGDTALGISRKFYGGKAEWGRDHRFFVNGLVYVNQGDGARGIYKPNPEDDWDTTQVRAGYMIWVPSISFMRSLKGVVKSGSITYEAWQTVKQTAIAVGKFLLGTGAFIVGLLHGALESLWDVLVGIKDLLVMAVDLIKWIVRYIAGDAKGLWETLEGIEWGKLVHGWIDDFVNKWNNEDFLKKWHFRGWVIGYAIAEVLMLIFSGGIINGIKWVGKSAKVAKVISKLPKIAEISKAAKASKAGQKLSKGLKASKAAIASLSHARKWAAATLRLSVSSLRDLTLSGINKLRQLSDPVLQRISRLSAIAKRWLLGCASECKVSLDKIRKSLKEMSDADLEKAAASRLANVLAKLRLPRTPVKFLKQGRNVDTDSLLQKVFAERKRLLREVGDDSWHRNIASARVTVDGRPRIITHVNDPGGLHSEAKILKEIQELRKHYRVDGIEIYSERIPCVGSACRSGSMQAFETVSYHSPHPKSRVRQSMKDLKKNIDFLKALYGLYD